MDRRLVEIQCSDDKVDEIKKQLSCEVERKEPFTRTVSYYTMSVPDCPETYKYLFTGPAIGWEFCDGDWAAVDKQLPIKSRDNEDEAFVAMTSLLKDEYGDDDSPYKDNYDVFNFIEGIMYVRQKSPALRLTKRFIQLAYDNRGWDGDIDMDEYEHLASEALEVVNHFLDSPKSSLWRYIYDGLKASWDKITKDTNILQVVCLIFLGTDEFDKYI